MEQHAIQLRQGVTEENKLTINMFSNYFVVEVQNDYMPQVNVITNTVVQKTEAVCSLCHSRVMSGLTEDLPSRTWLGWTRSNSTGLLMFIFISKALCSYYITTIRNFFVVLNIMWFFFLKLSCSFSSHEIKRGVKTQLHSFLTLSLEGFDWLAPRLGRFASEEPDPCT